jgi:uncharacterized low-complexity protein
MASKKTALTIALGSAFAASLSMVPAAHAAENPFAMQTLDKGYMVADAGDKAKEAKCGNAKKKAAPAATKAKEAKCGDMSAKSKDNMKYTDPKMPEGKCGVGKCGGKMAPKPEAKK